MEGSGVHSCQSHFTLAQGVRVPAEHLPPRLRASPPLSPWALGRQCCPGTPGGHSEVCSQPDAAGAGGVGSALQQWSSINTVCTGTLRRALRDYVPATSYHTSRKASHFTRKTSISWPALLASGSHTASDYANGDPGERGPCQSPLHVGSV